MDIYHIWCDLKSGIRDMEFVESVSTYFTHLQEKQMIHSYRVTRRKLGLSPENFPEFHIMVEFENLTQVDAAFMAASSRTEPVESFHQTMNSKAENVRFALYRDFPDEHRKKGEEKF